MPSYCVDSVFAYSIRALDSGWSWRVYDADGRIVADGESPTKRGAQDAIAVIYGVQETEVFEPALAI